MAEHATDFRPPTVPGVEALHARFVRHAYLPHSHPTWTVAVVHHGAARFDVDATPQRADRGELFVLEPEAVHTGMAAGGLRRVQTPSEPVTYKVAGPYLHGVLGTGVPGLELDEAVLTAVDALAPHLRPGPPAAHGRCEHAAVRRATAYVSERWDRTVALSELSEVCGLSRFALLRRFRAQTGLTPHAFQTNLRIARARVMLSAGEPPARVALECGFADQAHLTRTFKRVVGITPGRFALA